MPNAPSNFAINPYTAQLEDIERRRAYAQALQQQGMQPMGETQMAGGWAIPRSPMEGIGKIAQSIAGAYGQKQATEAQKQLAEKYQSDVSSNLARALRAGTGSPERPAALDPQESEQMADQGTAAPPNIPAQKPDLALMASILSENPNPAYQSEGVKQAMQNALLQRNMEGFGVSPGAGGAGGAPTPAASGAAQPGGATAAPGASAGPLLPPDMERQLLLADPSGKLLMTKRAEAAMAARKLTRVSPGGFAVNDAGTAVFSAPTTQGTITNFGPNGPRQSIVPGAVESQTALGNTPGHWVTNSDQTKSFIPTAQLAAAAGAPVNNPGNLRPQGASTGFQQFGSPQEGLAAIDKNLQAYGAKGINTLEGIISRWAPPSENNTAAYIADASKRLGVDPKQPIDLNNPAVRQAVGTAIMIHEQGPQKLFASNNGVGNAPKFGQTQEQQIQQAGQTAANTEAGKEFIGEMRQNYAKLRDVPATLANMDRAKSLAASQAREFMGPLGQSKLALVKFFRTNIPGMENLDTKGVTNAEELQSTLFNQVMDNLKKMDASPSQYQQQVMQEAFGTLRTDPASVPKILDVFAQILRNRVAIHNETVKSAESRGTAFPYDISIKLPEGNQQTIPQAIQGAKQAQAAANPQAIADEMRRRGLIK